jgi:hypothetical protein
MMYREGGTAMPHIRRLLPVLALAAGLAPLWAAGPADLAVYEGKVVPLADLVAQAGGRLDADAAPHELALVADGKVYTLVKDAGSRMFFKDKALLNRPMRLTGRLLPGSQVLRVSAVRSLVQKEWCEVYYWCEICSIKRGEKMVCECCGGPMVLREEPVQK